MWWFAILTIMGTCNAILAVWHFYSKLPVEWLASGFNYTSLAIVFFVFAYQTKLENEGQGE